MMISTFKNSAEHNWTTIMITIVISIIIVIIAVAMTTTLALL